jgi:mevalonate kinase
VGTASSGGRCDLPRLLGLPYGEVWNRLNEYVKEALKRIGVEVTTLSDLPSAATSAGQQGTKGSPGGGGGQHRPLLQELPGEVHSAEITGMVACYLGLAYAPYLLAHNVELQDRLIKRLKNAGNFQARTTS